MDEFDNLKDDELIRACLKEMGISQSKLARLTGCDRETICRYVTRDRKMQRSMRTLFTAMLFMYRKGLIKEFNGGELR